MPQGVHLLSVSSFLQETDGPQEFKEYLDLKVLRLPGIDVKITFVTNEHKSHVKISLTGSRPDERAVVNFPVEACERLKIQKVNSTWYQRVVGHKPARNSTCYLALLEFNLRHVCAEGLFVEGCASCFQPLQEYLSREKIIAFCLNDRNARRQSNGMLLAFEKEVSTGHMSPWERVFEKIPCLPVEPPETSVPAKVAFFDWREYAFTLGVGMEYERQLAETKMNTYKCQVRVVEIPGTRSKFHVVLCGPQNMKLAPGDKATLVFVDDLGHKRRALDEDKPPEKAWEIHISQPVSFSPRDSLAATMFRRGEECPRIFCGQHLVPIIRRDALPSGKAGRDLIATKPSWKATVRPILEDGTFARSRLALDVLDKRFTQPGLDGMDKAVLDLLLARHPSNIETFDIYAKVRDCAQNPETEMNLNDSQKEAVVNGRKAPGGFVLCHGGPGTGKTHFVVEAIRPFLTDAHVQHHLLLTSAGNAGADALAQAVHRKMSNLPGTDSSLRNRYVLRAHSIETEKNIFLSVMDIRSRVLMEIEQTGNTRGPLASIETSPEILQSNRDYFQHFTRNAEDLLGDIRAQVFQLSIGHRMLQVAGLIPGPFEVGDEWSTIRLLYYHSIRQSSIRSTRQFQTEMSRLMSHVISHATAVCATVAGAGQSVLCSSYAEAELLVVDEAARVVEYEWWPLLAFYPNIIGKIMVGDKDQLPPVLESSDAPKTRRDQRGALLENPFAAQLELSFQERLQTAGFRTAFFTVQHRALPEIAAICNNAVYDGRLSNHESTSLSRRPLAQKIVMHNMVKHGQATPVIFYDIPPAKEETRQSGSKYCTAYTIAALYIVEGLLAAGFGTTTPCTIAVLTPYHAEYEHLQMAKALMCEEYPQADSIVVDKIDKRQGAEFDVVIIDPCAVARAGFLQKQRLNVLFSRAKCGLYVLGKHSAWKSMYPDQGFWVRKFHAQLEKYRQVWPANRPLESRFFDPAEI
ncbi:P-loop containing nucleoside triphosphate hydrolase protein [Exophiala viscosa]|uniref:P-loop containing nucleoside triphosphate hydrolase protein n=1 Tax=Exophiala viscosa TaxID=2486360 RepID=UPI00219EBCCE|nr:P-loop containing nucleoside triphosphate hydrolase protein [Exophiala viscosa]